MKLSKFQVGQRYSRALYEVAVERESVEENLKDLQGLKKVYLANPGLNILFAGRSVSRTERAKVVETLKSGLGELMQDFLSMLFDRDRMDCLVEIADAYIERYDVDNGIVEVTVTTTVPLDSKQEENLRSVVKQRFSVKQANLTKVVDPSIIGGVIIRVGDQVIDGSVVKRFNDIKNMLLVNK
ncbi:ATP synthase F1 subunit delta [Companilactobacillus baiquanensis]|uniref:ATP synthase subunit delta n=1 Tax=Companilactobacillus baiquanensis TaxID=2486005 RepID=A0ABW1UX96_9LACO|nr:ATP synthase F1 subunit delta [Companilactobacillus baiquanensis]